MSKTIWIINHYALTPAQGGLCRHYYFAKELQKRGWNVRIFTSSAIHNTDINMIAADEPFFKDVDYEGVHYTYLKSSNYRGNGLARIKNMLGFAFHIKKIWKAYGKEKPDVIYTSTPDLFTAWKAELFAKKHKLPCVTEVRDLWPLSIVEYKGISEKNPAILALYVLEKKIYRRADAIAFTMPGGKDYVRDKKWTKAVSTDKIFNVNNGIDIALQEEQREKYIYEDEDLQDTSKFKVVYAGSVRAVNDVGQLVDCAKKLQDTDIKLIVFGDGTQKEMLEKRVAEENITNVVFKGRVDKKYIPSICAQADVNVINVRQTNVSKYGVSWNKLFDYMNAGRPILSTVKVNYDLIEKYDCGIACEKQDTETVCAALLKLRGMPKEEYEAMCARAKAAAKDFDYTILTDRMEEAIVYAMRSGERK